MEERVRDTREKERKRKREREKEREGERDREREKGAKKSGWKNTDEGGGKRGKIVN